MVAAARAVVRLDLVGNSLRPDVVLRVEPSCMAKRNMGLQSVCLAVAVCARRMVRAWWRAEPGALDQFAGRDRSCDYVPAACVLHRDDLVFSTSRDLCTEIRR